MILYISVEISCLPLSISKHAFAVLYTRLKWLKYNTLIKNNQNYYFSLLDTTAINVMTRIYVKINFLLFDVCTLLAVVLKVVAGDFYARV